jgi:hypothetical protein
MFSGVYETPQMTWTSTGNPVVLSNAWTGIGTNEAETFIDEDAPTFLEGGQIKINHRLIQEKILKHPTRAAGGLRTQLAATSVTLSQSGTRLNSVKVHFDKYNDLKTKEFESEVATERGSAYIRDSGVIIMTTPTNTHPSEHDIEVTYLVFDENRVEDITTTPLEFPRLDELKINIIN